MMFCGGFMKEYLLNYIKTNFKTIKTLLICLVIGVVIGVVIYQLIDENIRDELISSVSSTLSIAKGEGFEGINVLKNGILSNILISIIIYISSITLISPVCICALNVIRGVSIGIYISTIFAVFGIGSGILATILIIVLPNLIYIPAYIYMCTNSVNFHYLIIDKSSRENFLKELVKESYRFIIAFSLMILSVLIEQFSAFGTIALYIN